MITLPPTTTYVQGRKILSYDYLMGPPHQHYKEYPFTYHWNFSNEHSNRQENQCLVTIVAGDSASHSSVFVPDKRASYSIV